MKETISERTADLVDFPPQNVIIPRVSCSDTATLAAKDLLESLQEPTPNTLFAKINDTHHTVLRILSELFNIIPKAAKKQSCNRYIVQR